MEKNKPIKSLFTKKNIFTIPNFLSLCRILVIPFIVYFYVFAKKPHIAILIVLLSGLTDTLDGTIARKFNMTSDLGTVLDPLADKLTQIAMLLCLVFQFKWVRYLLILYVVKELIQLGAGVLMLKKGGSIYKSKWAGKVCTVYLYVIIVLLFLFPGIPEIYEMILCAIAAVLEIIALVVYLSTDVKTIRAEK